MPNLHLPLNEAEPAVMHIDLNSCFAMVEQQSRPLIRGRPVAITNRLTKQATIIAASYEAKAKGIKVGQRVSDARLLAPGLVVAETDPPKYHYIYQKLVRIMKSYSPDVVMKSIDEGIINFATTRQTVNRRSLLAIGQEIKARLKEDAGSWMSCNIGIGPNRFLAKTAASLHKPDGLDVIDHTNLRQVLKELQLTDLTGIAQRNQARLNAWGIMTPQQFLDAPAQLLRYQVFKSVCGEDWYKRLRGWEVDDFETTTRMVGRQYVLDKYHPDETTVRSRLAYLCETTGLKLRYKGFSARGISVHVRYETGDYWHERQAFKSSFFTNTDIYRHALLLFNRRPRDAYEQEIGVSCYLLEPSTSRQISLLDEVNRQVWLTEAIDTINQRWGEFTVTFAHSAASKGIVKQKIPFGSTKYFKLLCQQA